MLQPDMHLQDRYQIVRLLGQGGMGAVYEAIDIRLKTSVALKQTTVAGNELDQAFEREAQMLARLRHPALPLVSDYFTDAAGLFLVMQYIPGDDLATLMARQSSPFPIVEVLRWADQVLNTLEYLQRQQPPIIHRDIKPQNLKLMPDGAIVLLDFGLSKGHPMSADASGSMASVFGYTPQYAPLEQIHGTGTDLRSDLFALAATFYHLLTGVIPIDALQRATEVVAGRPDPLPTADSLRVEVPSAVAAVLAHTLALDPELRPASASALRMLLHEAMAAEMTLLAAPGNNAPTGEYAIAQPATKRTPPPNNVPAVLTPIVGRGEATAAAISMLGRDEIRLLTLTGPGGTGKTRLALQVALEQLESTDACFIDGVFFVSLTPVRESELVLSTIAKALGVRERGGQPLTETLQNFLHRKRMLLILDNFEQVVAAGPRIVDLLEAAPLLKLLVTSRETLRLRSEHELPVPPLSQPAAVQLFVQRAQAMRPDFIVDTKNEGVVAALCARLDGLPLAIELAAARIRSLTPAVLLERLNNRLKLLTGGARDLPTRQQTLRGTIDWSYDLLNTGEQLLFRRLGIFVGGRSLEAVEMVCNAAGDLPIDALDGIQSLIDKSLLYQMEGIRDEPRYLMLETIWEYAQEQLETHNEAPALRRAHAEFFLELAERAKPELRGPDQRRWLDNVDVEHANLRAALHWAEQTHEPIVGVKITVALARFWEVRGYLSEARRWLEAFLEYQDTMLPEWQIKLLNMLGRFAYLLSDYQRGITCGESALALAQLSDDQEECAAALNLLGSIARAQGDTAQALDYFQAALNLWRDIQSYYGVATGLVNTGMVLKDQDDYAQAIAYLEESRQIYRMLGDDRGVALALDHLAAAARSQRMYAYAETLQEECLTLRRAIGDKRGIAASLVDIGNGMLEQGEAERAIPFYEDSLTLFKALGELWGTAVVLDNLGMAWRYQGDYARAHAFHDDALMLRQELGDQRGLAMTRGNLGIITLALGDLQAAHDHFVASLSLWQEAKNSSGICDALEGLADLACAQGQPLRAAQLASFAAALRGIVGVPLMPIDQPSYLQMLDAIRSQLSDDRFNTAWETGGSMTLEQAIAYAREEGM